MPGYLLKAYRYGERGQRDSCAQMMKKRWYSLVIPYGVFSALAILAHLAFLTIHGGSRLAALKGDVILTVTLRGVATLWFLPTLLIAELMIMTRQIRIGPEPPDAHAAQERTSIDNQ